MLIHNGAKTIFANLAYAEIFGHQDPQEILAQNSPFDHIAPHERERVIGYSKNRLSGGDAPTNYEFEGRKKDGSSIWLDNRVGVVTWDGQPAVQRTVIDITERKQLEEQLRQSQRMEAIGQLTGGVAHDFNNLMAVMMGNMEAALDFAADDAALRDHIEAALDAVGRGAVLTQQLLSFSRQQSLSPEHVDANALIADTLTFLGRTLGETITITSAFDPAPLPVQIDTAIFGNALVNVALNARDAMPDGGTLAIKTRRVDPDGVAPGGAAPGGAAPEGAAPDGDGAKIRGPHVLITVTDTGSGIRAEDLDRVLEPFFTTKDVGKGSGLGLSMVHGFVRQSGGHLAVASSKGAGTTVSLWLPLSAQPDEGAAVETATAAPELDKMMVLLVEDEKQARQTTASMLSSLGCAVLEAGDGPEALAILADRGAAIDLVLTDVIMPNAMSGFDLANAIRAAHGGTKVLLMSGYPDRIADQTTIGDLGLEVLAKPYRTAQLAASIKRASAKP